MPRFTAQSLVQLATNLLERAGASRAHAQIVADHLVAANLAGHDSHGVLRVLQYVASIDSGLIKPNGKTVVVDRFAAGAVLDGGGGFGQVAGREATLLAIEIAREAGVSAVTLHHCHHTGRIGTYTEMCAAEGLIGICVVNSGGGAQVVPPFGGLGRRLSTNPISIAAPTAAEHPLVLDMATTVAPEGKVRAAFQAGKPVPEGWLMDADGRVTTDAAQLYAERPGALVPIGGIVGYKGFGLSLMIDILAGVLTGAGGCQPERAYPGDGLFIIALDTQRFQPLANFRQCVTELADYIRSSPTAPGFERVYVPGEPEIIRREQRLREGILVEQGTWTLLEELCQRFNVAAPSPV
jgi:LDH2 family malate/lactate/ureidoglycolate dehydrogenase